MLTSGQAFIHRPDAPEGSPAITIVDPFRLIGDMAVIPGSERLVDMVADEPSRGLRIGPTELMAVIENDASVALSLLKTVTANLQRSGRRLSVTMPELPEERVGRVGATRRSTCRKSPHAAPPVRTFSSKAVLCCASPGWMP